MAFIELPVIQKQIVQKAIKYGPRRKVSNTYKRQSALVKQMGNAVRVNFLKGIDSFKKNLNPGEMLSAWKSGNYNAVVETIPWEKLPDHLENTRDSLLQTMKGGYQLSLDSLKVPKDSHLRTDTSNDHFHSYLKNTTANLVTNVQDSTRDTIREAVRNSFDRAQTPRDIANQLRSSVGLDKVQARALQNYRQSLTQDGKSQNFVDRVSKQYEERLLNVRAMRIARTETRNANNASQLLVWREAKNQGLIGGKTTKKSWVVDGNPCPICEPMDGIAVGLDELWDLNNGDSVDIPSESHPNCFPAGYKVLTSRGLVPIEQIQVGDYVITHRERLRKVTRFLCREYEGELIHLVFGKTHLSCTPEHPFLIENQWVKAIDLRKGDQAFQILSSDAFSKSEIVISQSSQADFKGNVYNISVEEDESYVCEGIVTHNCFCGMELLYEEGDGESTEESSDESSDENKDQESESTDSEETHSQSNTDSSESTEEE